MLVNAPSDAFIGRRAELEELSALLSGEHRLVTLLGPPGIGKTRLALEYIRCAGPADRDGRLYCVLADARDVRGLCAAVMHTLKVPSPHRASRDAKATMAAIGSALAARGSLLLVLDNLEQLMDCVGTALTTWLDAAPGLKLLVTSRERLRIPAEHVFELPPLGLPMSEEDAPRAEAMQLFEERARVLEPAFSIDAQNARTAARLVRKLDGIPLAIELAAARIGVLGLDELEARLPGSLDVLSWGKRHAPGRQATMRGAVQWSWDLLNEGEQRALMGAAIFRGGFSTRAAESVLALFEPAALGGTALDLIHSLREKSLIHKAEPAAAEPRFDVYVGIREFAEEQLAESGVEGALRLGHAQHFVAEAELRSRELERAGSASALAWLRTERSNLLAACEHVLRLRQAPGRVVDLLQAAGKLAVALEPVLVAQGPIELLSELVSRVLAQARADGLSPALSAQLLGARAQALQLMGCFAESERDLSEALRVAEASADRALLARLLAELGVLHHRRRQTAAARDCYERALAIQRDLGDLRQQARTLGNLGALCHDLAELGRADEYYEQALQHFRRLDDPRWEGIFMTNRGILEQEQGRFAAARRHYAEAVERLEHAGDARLLGITHGNLGVLEHECGNLEAAHALHLRAWQELEDVGDVHSQALCLARLGATHAVLGRSDRARADLAAATRLLGPFSDPTVTTAVELHAAFLDLAAQSTDDAALGRARNRMQAARTALDVSDDVRSTLRILERAIAQASPMQDVLEKLPREALVVGPSAAWFRPPHGRLQDLRKYAATRRILQALIDQREQAACELSIDALREAGWPNERVDFHSGANRVHVALADLRKRGLKKWLVRNERGYALDTRLRVEPVSIELPESSEPPGA